MKTKGLTSCFALLLTVTAAASGRSDSVASDSASPAPAAPGRYGTVPLGFGPNRGQAPPDVHFIARGAGYAILLTKDGTRLTLGTPRSARRAEIRLRFGGAQVPEGIEPLERLPGAAHYVIGNDPAAWQTDLPRSLAFDTGVCTPASISCSTAMRANWSTTWSSHRAQTCDPSRWCVTGR